MPRKKKRKCGSRQKFSAHRYDEVDTVYACGKPSGHKGAHEAYKLEVVATWYPKPRRQRG